MHQGNLLKYFPNRFVLEPIYSICKVYVKHMWSTTWMSRICANIFECMLIIWTRHQTPLWLCLTWIILLKEEQNYFLHTIYCACPNYAFGKSLISSSQNAKVLCHTMGLCSVNGWIRGGQMLSTGKKWQQWIFKCSKWGGKKLITDVQKLSHNSSMWRNNPERISGQHAMKERTV